MSSEPTTVVDTVILRYFLFTGQERLLVALAGRPIAVPRVIFDPEQGAVPDEASCELSRSIRYQRAVADDPARDERIRGNARSNADALERVHGLHAAQDLLVLDLDDRELEIMAALTSPSGCRAFGLLVPLHPGEAACIALAVTRGMCLATDDTDALKALAAVNPNAPYERIRRLLIRAATNGLIDQGAANSIHTQMVALGFRDTQSPFPDL